MLRTAASLAARSLLVLSLGVPALLASNVASARESAAFVGEPTILLTELPRQGQQTYRLIFEGGPFPHEKDGSVFGNRERLLPRERRGHYREYTVETPGARNRGARRMFAAACQSLRPRPVGTPVTTTRVSRGSCNESA